MSKNWLMNRRRVLLWLGLGTCGGTSIIVRGERGKSESMNQQIQALLDPKRDFTVVGEASLKKRAAAKGLSYGAAVRYDNLFSDTAFATCFAQECGILVPEWEFKWCAGNKLLRPSPDSFDFTAADQMAKFAQAHGLLLRGHTLVWHESLPSWFENTVNRQNAEQILVKHIKTVVGRYTGKMHSWDVVNEAISHDPTKGGRSDGLRQTPWLELLGPNYIDLAFRVAAKADPHALLVYNDYGVDYDTDKDEAKRTTLLKLLEHLKSMGTPVNALGIQAHMWGSETRFNQKKLQVFLKDVASLGLKILITEMDVADHLLPSNVVVRDRIVAGIYEDYLSVVLDEPAVIALITWGLSDRYAGISEYYPRSDKAQARPLPYDAQLKRKLTWNAIARAFDRTPRHKV